MLAIAMLAACSDIRSGEILGFVDPGPEAGDITDILPEVSETEDARDTVESWDSPDEEHGSPDGSEPTDLPESADEGETREDSEISSDPGDALETLDAETDEDACGACADGYQDTETCQACEADVQLPDLVLPDATGACKTVADCDDGIPCTTDACDPTGCTHVLVADWCVIEGACVASGAKQGKCMACNPTKAHDEWTYAEGTACDDEDACTTDDLCVAGRTSDSGCQGTHYSCADGLTCTDDVCDGKGACSHPLQDGFCLVEGACRGFGESNPSRTCEACRPGLSNAGWSFQDDATPCGPGACDGQFFTTAKSCVSGDCIGGGASESCDDKRACTADTCEAAKGCVHETLDGWCLVGGECRGEGQPNPDNPCQVCSHAGGPTAWSATTDGAVCEAATCSDGLLKKRRTCVSGQCASGGGTQSCDDGNPCTDDACDAAGNACLAINNAKPCAAARCEGSIYHAGAACEGGTCPSQVPVDCAGANPCTDDGCDVAQGGCTSKPVSGGACGSGGECQAGQCVEPLTVTVAGGGGGTVSSSPGGISSCTGSCNATFTYGAPVTLTPTAVGVGAVFMGWSGDCIGPGPCILSMTLARSVTATFGFPLTVTKSGPGGGTLTSTPTGLSCGTTCAWNFAYGTGVSVQNAAGASSCFTHWSIDCSGSGTCSVTMDQPRTVDAGFGPRLTWYRDADGDKHGTADITMLACTPPDGYVADKLDCNDSNADIKPGAAELCDGIDNNCNGLTDQDDLAEVVGGFFGGDQPLCGNQKGACAGARKVASLCVAGQWGACGDAEYAAHAGASFNPGFETLCDGVDNDCDGATDEDLVLVQPDGSSVTGVGRTCGIGACTGGTTQCAADHSLTCSSLSAAVGETCNGIDDDCDGLTDAADGADLSGGYFPNDRPPCEKHEGVCAGVQKPASLCQGGFFLPCTDATYQAVALAYQSGSELSCDGRDNDCDGLTDEDATLKLLDGTQVTGAGKPCGVGRCAGGVTICKADQSGIECLKEREASIELCDDIDNDCDGQTDEGLSQPCWTGTAGARNMGICHDGTSNCTGGTWGTCAGQQLPVGEKCNFLDDDCDGLTDAADLGSIVNGAFPGDHPLCANQSGVCAGATARAVHCVGGSWQPCGAAEYAANATANGTTYEAGAESLCDALDNNCNSQTDENVTQACYIGPAGTSGVGICKPGVKTCSAGVFGSCVGQVLPAVETCNGLDDDCNHTTDAADFASPASSSFATDKPNCEKQAGVCQGSKKTVDLCVAGAWIACTAATYSACATSSGKTYQVVESLCDGQDNDCDGTTDAGLTHGCFTGPAGQRNVGACKDGVQTCIASVWGACTGSVQATAETCNGVDDDCNGLTDDGPSWTNRGTVCAVGIGACKRTGAYICDPISPTGPTVCSVSEGTASTEVCNGLDDNCDGQTDEGATWSNKGAPCTAGQGICVRSGVYVCDVTAPLGLTVCGASPGAAGTEVCNGLDDDCNGLTDDGPLWSNKGTACTVGLGACRRTGVFVCNTLSPAGPTICSATAGTAGTEVCNGLDDNCNGLTDEGALWANMGTACTVGIGACRRSGVYLCNNSNPPAATVCSALAGTGGAETCNGQDDDCNGQTDEGLSQPCYTGPAPTRHVGSCQDGSQTCSAGVWGTCVGEVKPYPENCNHLDDDCNGFTDDGITNSCYTGTNQTRNVGRCHDGTGTCIDGVWVACASQQLPVVETCNNLDDDCDGMTDGNTRACYTGPVVTRNVGSCKDGVQTCVAGSWAASCVGQTLPAVETCNGLDDDCDGATDNGVTQACYTGAAATRNMGTCHDGTTTCAAGTWGACLGQQLPGAETCNLGDDDCDGVTDESPACPVGQVCRSGTCTNPCPAGFAPIQAGEFDMGSPDTEPGDCTGGKSCSTERPVHHVVISWPFCLKETAVTQGEWQALMENNPSHFASCGSTCPVDYVSWWDSVAYCNALSTQEGLSPCYSLTGCSGTPGTGSYTCSGVAFAGLSCTGYRLPTEAEWEYAARAGTTTATYNGTVDSSHLNCEEPNTVLDAIAWFGANSCTTAPSATCSGGSGCGPHPVKGKQANAWGLYDMLGNVLMWCWDWWSTYPTGSVTDPTGPSSEYSRMIRGGSWAYPAGVARAAHRGMGGPSGRLDNVGFRPARTAAP